MMKTKDAMKEATATSLGVYVDDTDTCHWRQRTFVAGRRSA